MMAKRRILPKMPLSDDEKRWQNEEFYLKCHYPVSRDKQQWKIAAKMIDKKCKLYYYIHAVTLL